MWKCRECGCRNSDYSETCAGCGKERDNEELTGKKKWPRILLLILACAALLALLVWLLTSYVLPSLASVWTPDPVVPTPHVTAAPTPTPTPSPTPTPTPAPTPTPTPVPTPTPTPTKPGPADLDAVHADVVYPFESYMYLDERIETVTICGPVLCFKDPNYNIWADGNYFYVEPGTKVTILAESKGSACVILKESQTAGWINIDYLAEH
ncbi:MAG: hypothetical protein K6C08_08820 [Oscillospiraceae bacterium]|nr:hypothetical protein [Oscillospiraceae bacterium]